jgi:hypothetical protein
MACNAVADYLHRHGSVFLEDTYAARVFPGSIWLQLMPRGVFPQGKGHTISQVIYERVAPTSADPAWQDMLIEDGQEGGTCLGPTINVPVGSTSVTTNIKRLILRGPDFCAEDLRFAFNPERQLANNVSSLVEYVKRAWEDRDRNEYFRACKYKVAVVAAGLVETVSYTATAYPTTQADAIMTLGILEEYRVRLIQEGATPMLLQDGMPILTAICSMGTQGAIVRGNAALRQDLRDAYSSAGERSLVLKGLGASFAVNGILLLADTFVRKFSFAGGVYTPISPFTLAAATKGQRAEVNSTWRTATLEETVYFDQEVMTQLIPTPISSLGSGFEFNPVTYTGDWAMLNIPHADCNPRGQIVFPHGVLAAATLLGRQEMGAAFVHKSCTPPLGLTTTCPT